MGDPRIEKLVASDDTGEYQALIPRNKKEASLLRSYARSARRFLAAVEGALAVYDGKGSDRVVSLKGGRR